MACKDIRLKNHHGNGVDMHQVRGDAKYANCSLNGTDYGAPVVDTD
jgi:hypothetical protein